MKDKERRQYEMLQRIRDFGHAHGEVFTGWPAAREAFESVSAAVRELAAADLLKLSARAEGRADRKASARKALITPLVRVSQLARVLRARGRTLPAFAIPRSSSDQGWLTLARQFQRDAATLEAELIRHGLDPAAIEGAAGAFAASVRDRAMKQADHTEARTRIHDLITSALLEARRLDLIVGNESAGDNVIRAVWEHARRVERPRRPQTGTGESAAPASPSAAAISPEPTRATVIPMMKAA